MLNILYVNNHDLLKYNRYTVSCVQSQCIKSICGICGAQLTFDFRKLHVILICAVRNLQFKTSYDNKNIHLFIYQSRDC